MWTSATRRPQGGRCQAEDWRTKAMGTRKANEDKKNAGPGGITMGDNGELK